MKININFLNNLTNKLSIKSKLFCFAIISIILILFIVGTVAFYNSKIQRSATFMSYINVIVQDVQDARVNEKTYLQFYLPQLEKKLNEHIRKALENLQILNSQNLNNKYKIQLKENKENINKYKLIFEKTISIHNKLENVNKQMVVPLKTFNDSISKIILIIEVKESDLQMEGEDLPPVDAEMLNIARDAKIVGLNMLVLQEKYMKDGKEKYVKEFNTIKEEQLNNIFVSLEEFADNLKNNEIIQSINTAKKSVDTFADFAKQSQLLRANQKGKIKLLDKIGIDTIIINKALLKEIETEVKTIRRSAGLIILCVVIISIIVFIFISYAIIRSIINPINRAVEVVNAITSGDASKRLVLNSEDEIGKMVQALNNIPETIEKMLKEFGSMIDNVESGKISSRGNDKGFEGFYAEIVKGANNLANVFVNLINNIPIPIFIMDKDLNIIFISKPCLDLINKKENEVLGQKCADILKQSNCNSKNCTCMQSMQNLKAISNEASLKLTDKIMEVISIGMPLFDSNNQIVGSMEILIDQSEIKNKMQTINQIDKYQKNEVESLSKMLYQVIQGNMTVKYNPEKTNNKDILEVYNGFENISKALNTTVEKIGKVNNYQETEVKLLSEILDKISKGDLTVQYDVTEADDDTKEVYENFKNISNGLNITSKNLAQMIGELKNNSKVLESSSEKLSDLSNQLVKNSTEMTTESDSVFNITKQVSNSITTVAASSEQMSVNVASVSSTAEEMSVNMNTVATSVEQMSVAINDIGKNSQEGAVVSEDAIKMSQSANKTMNALGEAAKGIGEITEVIKRIADQTNLLALNATIEAASAGEAGKGFAVVASEIKKLATQSAGAAEDIANRISGVQENTKEAVDAIGDVSEIINKLNEATKRINVAVDEQTKTANEISSNVKQTNSGVTNIASSVGEVAKGINDMSTNVGEAAKGSNDVLTSIQGVNKISHQANLDSNQVNTSAQELSKIAGRLSELVNKFKV